MDNVKKFLRIFDYAYQGLMVILYTMTFKREKIVQMYRVNDDEINLKMTEEFQKEDFEEKKMESLGEKEHYKYEAVEQSTGKKVVSTFDAYNIDQAKKFLEQEGLSIKKMTLRSKYDIDLTIGAPLSVAELSFMLTQMATYIRAGMTLVDSVRILAKQTKKATKRKIYELLIFDLLAGDSFSAALSHQPKAFPKLLTNMVKSSELTGDLPAVLEDMADYYTSIDKTRKDVKSALTYPIFVLIFTIVVLSFVLIWVVPQYETMFSGYGVELPKITVMTLALSNFLQKNLVGILIWLIVILLVYIYLFKNVRSFRLMMQTFYLKLPVIGNIIMYSEIAMFTKTFASLLNHGVYITDSMDVLVKVSDNEVYRNIILKTVVNLSKGGKISESFANNWAIPIVAYEMIVTGENTGQLGTMMDKVYHYYDGQHKNAVTSLKSLIEPIVIIFLAGGVGLIILSVILPMFQMYQSLS